MGRACWSQLNEKILHLHAGVNNCESVHKSWPSKVEINLVKSELMCAIDHHHSPSISPPPRSIALSVCQPGTHIILSHVHKQIYCHVIFTLTFTD